MLTPEDISTTILNGQYALAIGVNKDLVLMYGACQPKSWAKNMCFNAIIKALQYQLNRQDYTSDLIYSLYNKVIGLTGYTGNIPGIDPNFQAPNTTIVVEGGGGTIVNSGKYPFVNTTSIGLYTYNILYKHLFGNNPTVTFYLNNSTQDAATPDNIQYQNPSDINSDILSITWDYGLPVSGYISITGSPEA